MSHRQALKGGYMTQKQMILKHLQTVGAITPLEALQKYGCFRLGARIADLKADGVQIKSELIKENGKRYARYELEQ